MPPFIREVSFADALERFRLVGWRDDGQSGSHRSLARPARPGVRLHLPDHRRQDLDPMTLGRIVESAGLTREQFGQLSGQGHLRRAREIRRQVYGCMVWRSDRNVAR